MAEFIAYYRVSTEKHACLHKGAADDKSAARSARSESLPESSLRSRADAGIPTARS